MEEAKEYTYDKASARAYLKKLRECIADRQEKVSRASHNAMRFMRGNVMIYVSMGSELSTDFLIDRYLRDRNVTLFAPYSVDGAITPRRIIVRGVPDRLGNMHDDCYGESSDSIDVCITPLLGVDTHGYRLGYGKGCYDRYFSLSKAKRVGLCFTEQFCIFGHDSHDIPLDCCVTPDDVIYF